MATFHTALLVLLVLLVAYLVREVGPEIEDTRPLEGLEETDPLAGLVLLIYLWVIVWITSAGALRRLEWPDFCTERVMEAAAIWGGVTGLLLWGLAALPGMLVVALAGLLSLDPVGITAAFFVVVLYGLLLIPIVFVGGVFVGLLFGLLDTLLFAASRRFGAEFDE